MNTNAVTVLRDIVPLRPLRYLEAIRLAEFQAQKFLALSGITDPAVPERIIRDLPKLHIARLSPFPASGASHWSNGRWMVALNGAEPATRQRFSLAHEFKHIIDHRFVKLMYGAFPEAERHQMIEQVCDYFAGCLLMPRPWVKRLYYSGINQLSELAEAFGVSQAAMTVRLSQIGIVQAPQRCIPANRDWTPQSLEDWANYQRAASVAA